MTPRGWQGFVLAPTGGQPLALDFNHTSKECGNKLRMLDHFQQFCCLIDNISACEVASGNSELIVVKTNVHLQIHHSTSKMHNQPDDLPQKCGIVLEDPS